MAAVLLAGWSISGHYVRLAGPIVSRPGPREARSTITAQGHPRAIFQRAIARANLMVAETVAREIGRISLLEALELTALIALKDPRRRSRVAARWLLRFLEEHDQATIEEAVFAAGALSALGGPGHDEAHSALAAVAERVTRQRRRPR